MILFFLMCCILDFSSVEVCTSPWKLWLMILLLFIVTKIFCIVEYYIVFIAFCRAQKIEKMCHILGIEFVYDPDSTYELTADNVKKMLAIYMRFRFVMIFLTDSILIDWLKAQTPLNLVMFPDFHGWFWLFTFAKNWFYSQPDNNIGLWIFFWHMYMYSCWI